MEPHQERKAPPPGAEQKPRRFRIIKLEERIAPKKGGNTKHGCDTGFCPHKTMDTCSIVCGW